MLTEFYVGYDKTGGEKGDIDLKEMTKLMDYCDESLISWIGWEYKPYHAKTGGAHSLYFSNGTFNLEFVKLAARPYAQIVAGRAINMNFNQTFELQFLVTQETFKYESVIFLNDELHFSQGFIFNVNKEGFIISKLKLNHYSVTYQADLNPNVQINDLIMIRIEPK